MHRPHGDPDSPPASQNAWLWHDLALPLRIEPLSPSPTLHQRFETLLLESTRNETPQGADELSRMALGLSESAPDLRARACWQITAGFFEAIAVGALKSTPESQRLMTQILQQYTLYQQAPHGDAIDELLCHDLLALCLEACAGQDLHESAMVLPRLHETYAAQALPELNLIWPEDEEADVADVPGTGTQEAVVLEPEALIADTPVTAASEVSAVSEARVPPLPSMALTQLQSWANELAQTLSTWATKPSRPLPPTAQVLPRVMSELMASEGLQLGAETASALLSALGRAQQAIGLLPIQATVLSEAAQALQTYLLGPDPKSAALSATWTETLQHWPPAAPPPDVQAGVESDEEPKVEPAPQTQVPPKVWPKPIGPAMLAPDAPRLLYFSSILPRLQKALPKGELLLRDAGVALVRSDLQALAGLLDQLIAHLYQQATTGPDAPVATASTLHVRTLPAHGRLGVQLSWGSDGADWAINDEVPPVQAGPSDAAWQSALEGSQASWDGSVLSLPVQHLSCRVRRLRAGDLSFALVDEGDAMQAGDGLGDAWALRQPPVQITEVLESQEVLMAAPSPVMRRLPGVVGVLPKTGGGLPVLVYSAGTRRT